MRSGSPASTSTCSPLRKGRAPPHPAPGVRNCDECVALAERIGAEMIGKRVTRGVHAWASMTDDKILDHLSPLAVHLTRPRLNCACGCMNCGDVE